MWIRFPIEIRYAYLMFGSFDAQLGVRSYFYSISGYSFYGWNRVKNSRINVRMHTNIIHRSQYFCKRRLFEFTEHIEKMHLNAYKTCFYVEKKLDNN